MKKTSLLLAVGALLYGASGSYALAKIYEGMPENEILDAIKKCPGVAKAVDLTAEEAGAEDAVFDVAAADPLPPPPANIWVNDENPVHMSEFCGFQPTGGAMANFKVSVNSGASSATFESLSPTSGVAVGGGTPENGGGWLLFQQGDTWDQKWCLVTEMPITDIKIDPLSRTGSGPEKYAFDIIKDPTHSDEDVGGSHRGWPVTGDAAFTATYSQPVLVGSHPNDIFPPASPFTVELLKDRWIRVGQDNTHDMYGTLEIKFKKPVSGQVDLPALFTYRADTDCLPVKEAKFDSYQSGIVNFTLTGDGSAYIAERCGASSNLVAGPFAIAYIDGEVGFSTPLTPQENCCYSVVNVADDGTQNTVPLRGVSTNVNNEVCL